MKIQIADPAPSAPPRLSLDDLFVSRLNSDRPDERVQDSVALGEQGTRRWTQWLDATGQLPDTPFAAAWLLLQARWLGEQQPDPSESARTWLALLDQERRQASTAGSAGPLEPSPKVLWLGCDPGVDGVQAPLLLWLSTTASDTPRLHASAAASLLDAASVQQLLAAIADTAADLLERPECPLREIRTLP
ncbi:MAG: hypothetical protein JF617_04635, partial [Burkholderiales bacterium]|nr:hypothetical protein [Burkholderiales bacterium]